MTISIFTDEINRESPERAITLAKAWGISHVEVRSLWQGRFPNVSDSERETFEALLKQSGLSVSGVSPGFCKCAPDDPSIPHVLSEGLPLVCDWAKRLGTDHISCFAFSRTDAPGPPSEVTDFLGKMADVVQAHGCRLVLENEASCWGGTGLEAAEIIHAVGADKISLCWDPGNAARAGATNPFPDEYTRIKDLISHVHIKNFRPDTGDWGLADEGMIDWPGQLAALIRDGYTGHVVIETHTKAPPEHLEITDESLTDLERNTLHNLQFIRQYI